MKGITLTFSILIGSFYMFSSADAANSKIVSSQVEQSLYGDTIKNNSANAPETTPPNGYTQQVLDSLNNNEYSGVYYSNFGNSEPQKVDGQREPNSYKSGRTGGQYDKVNKPGVIHINKR